MERLVFGAIKDMDDYYSKWSEVDEIVDVCREGGLEITHEAAYLAWWSATNNEHWLNLTQLPSDVVCKLVMSQCRIDFVQDGCVVDPNINYTVTPDVYPWDTVDFEDMMDEYIPKQNAKVEGRGSW